MGWFVVIDDEVNYLILYDYKYKEKGICKQGMTFVGTIYYKK